MRIGVRILAQDDAGESYSMRNSSTGSTMKSN
jgi:hypothetical protein